MQKKVFDGSIDYYQVMDENGNVDQALAPKDVDDNRLLEMYRWMSLARAMDAKALSLQRQGRIATYAPLVGEEATQIGPAFAMGKNDILVPNFRQHGIFITRGAPISSVFLGFAGYEESNIGLKKIKALPMAVPVATQVPHSVGVAYAQKFLKTGAAVVVYVGDGGTSEGDFYEAINFAGVFKVPLVIIIENNQWAISVPRSEQSAAQTLAQKAIAAGIKGVQVDGNDVLATYKIVKDAIAASKEGPVLVECITYRMSMHTTADDPAKYRPESDVAAWKKKDPLLRVRTYLIKKNLWNDDMEQKLADENLKKVDTAVVEFESFKADPRSMFRNIYSYMPETLQEELDDMESNNFYQG